MDDDQVRSRENPPAQGSVRAQERQPKERPPLAPRVQDAWPQDRPVNQERRAERTSREGELAAEFLERYRGGGEYLRDNVDALAALATSGDEQQISAATEAIFQSVIEPLSDSFEPDSVGLYIRLMAQIVQHCRRLDARIDGELNGFGLRTEQDLIDRAERLRPGYGGTAEGGNSSCQSSITTEAHGGDEWRGGRAAGASPSSRPNVIIVLSRVTIGADVAITGVIIETLEQKFPNASLTIVGAGKLKEILGADSRLAFAELEYGRRATLIERLGAWVSLVSLIRELTAGLSSDEYLVVDPDSRLTQLGLLPVAPDSNYLFFPSREYMSASGEPLAALASDWSAKSLGLDGRSLQRLALPESDVDLARAVIGSARGEQSRPVVCINFGVGDNDRKRVGLDFEATMIEWLINYGAIVILDRGAGKGEASNIDSLVGRLSRNESFDGARTLGSEAPRRELTLLEANEEKLRSLAQSGRQQADLLVVDCRLGLLAAFIGASDLYIGYDSAGQHIAAAAGVPCIDVFAGYSSRRMLDRWRPTGPGETTVIDGGGGMAADEITAGVKARARELLKVGDDLK